MNRAPRVVAISAAYLCLASFALYLWLSATTPALPGYVALVCALPLALLLLVAGLPSLSARERIARSLAAFLFLPMLLWMWGLSADLSAASEAKSAPEPETLSVELLFRHAVARQEVPQAAGMSFKSSAAVFHDGSELRISRFASSAKAEAHLKLLTETFHTNATTLGAYSGSSAQLAANQLVYWQRHGASVLELHAGSRALAQARLEAQHVPVASAAGAPEARALSSAEANPTLLALSAAFVHAAAFCLFVFWSAAATTRVAAQVGSARLSQAALWTRIDALSELGARCRVSPGESAHERVIALSTESSGRARQLTLRCDEAGRVVRVNEIETASGVAPESEGEASMRAPGDPRFAPARPDAQRVWNKKRQATPIEPQRLRDLPLTFADGAPSLPQGFAVTLDGDGIVHLVCALVISAGFDYQPVLALFQGGSKP